MTLDRLGIGESARIESVAWSAIAPEEAKRLQALGVDVGAEIAVVHRGIFGGADPLALRLGNMTIALRRLHSQAISVDLR